jgi:hypothetical protein
MTTMLMFMSKSSWHIYVTKVLPMIKEMTMRETSEGKKHIYMIWDNHAISSKPLQPYATK